MEPRRGRITVEQYEADDLTYHRPDWHLQAACRGYIAAGKDLWFPSNDSRGKRSIVAQAKAICATCPVQQQCLEYAMTRERALPGIWGGLTGQQRRQLHLKGTKPGPVPKEQHGTAYRYDRHRCRCNECCAAHTKAQARYRAQRAVS